jgi:alkylhydroperoxidase family enzyme
MTWLTGLPDGGTDWDSFATLCPEAFDALTGLVRAAWQDTDPALLELARLRIATLLRCAPEQARRTTRAAGLADAKVAELHAWPTSPLFTARERACLALAEQFVMDANGVTEGLVAEVAGHLGPDGCYAFVQAVSVLETFQRACLTLGITTMPDLEAPAGTGLRTDATPEVLR